MNIFYAAFCRAFQTICHLALPILPYRRPEVYNSVNEVPQILKRNNINSALLVTDSELRALGSTA